MEDQDRDHISSRSHFSGRSEQELDEMLDELRAGKIGINQPGRWREALNTDSMHYHGSNQGNGGVVESDAIPSHGREHSLSLTLPPLATIWLVREAQ